MISSYCGEVTTTTEVTSEVTTEITTEITTEVTTEVTTTTTTTTTTSTTTTSTTTTAACNLYSLNCGISKAVVILDQTCYASQSYANFDNVFLRITSSLGLQLKHRGQK